MDIVLFNQSDTQLTPEQDLILIDFFGYSSGVFVGITLLPQVIKVFKTKSTKDLSHIFLALSLIAAASKFIYGILINQLPIVVTAPIIGIETLIIMIAKCVFDRRIDKKVNDKKVNDKDIVNKLQNVIDKNEIEGVIKYKKEDVNMEISKDKIIINTLELDFQTSIIQNICDFISKEQTQV